VTHDPRVAAFAPRIIMLRDGEVVSDGPREALPRTTPLGSGGTAA
jgi:ABC-type lipoprotein export system ATPase subunit